MNRQCEYKKSCDPEHGRCVKKHIYGDGMISNVLKSISNKILGKTIKDFAKTGANKLVETTASKIGEFLGNKAGDKIVQISSEKQKKSATYGTITCSLTTIY